MKRIGETVGDHFALPQIRDLVGRPADQPVLEINLEDNTERMVHKMDMTWMFGVAGPTLKTLTAAPDPRVVWLQSSRTSMLRH